MNTIKYLRNSGLGAAVLTVAIMALTSGIAFAETEQLLDFELKDQFDNVHTREDVRGRILLLIGSDKDGSEFNEVWGKALDARLNNHPRYAQLAHLAFADLRAVPFFARGFARGMMPENPDNQVLLDWKGRFAGAYNLPAGFSNVLVFAADGALAQHSAVRELNDEALDALVTVLRQLLDDTQGAAR